MQDADTQPADNSQAFEAAFSPPEPAVTGGDDGGDGSGGQPRDDHGRFAPTKGEDIEAAAGQEQPQARAEPEKDHRIPIRELLDERDRRQAAERRAQELERQWAESQRHQQQPPQRPDLLADPDGFADYLDQSVGGRVKTVEDVVRERFVNLAFDMAVDQHGQEAIDTAMEALEKARDPRAAAEIQNATNPAKALMRWHSRHRAMTEVGDDLDGFKQKHKSELMTDPEFRKEFMAALDAEARGGDAGRSSTVTSLPSVNRAPGSAGNQRPGSLGDGPEERFSNAFAPRRRA